MPYFYINCLIDTTNYHQILKELVTKTAKKILDKVNGKRIIIGITINIVRYIYGELRYAGCYNYTDIIKKTYEFILI